MMTKRSAIMTGLAAAGLLLPLAVLHPVVQAQANPARERIVIQSRGRVVRMTTANARVSAVDAVPGEADAMQLFTQGQALSPQAAAGLARKVAAAPDDLAAHVRLLGYYSPWQADHRRTLPYAAYQQAFYDQLFWLIQNHPQSVLFGTGYTVVMKRWDPPAYDHAEALWLTQTARQPRNATLLGNAAEFCLLSDEPTAERLLEQAAAIEPQNLKWPLQLGELYSLQIIHASADVRQTWAQKSLAAYEKAQSLRDADYPPSEAVRDLPIMAYDAGEYGKARQYATNLLQLSQSGQDFDAGGDTQHANLVLGLLALQDGQTQRTEQYLQSMGNVSGSPSLDSFGPNMRLAKALLERGDRQPVLAYLRACARFWKHNNGQLAAWQRQINHGQTPNFSANLDY